MNLENIMLSEEKDYKRTQTIWFPWYEMSKIGKSIQTRSWLVIFKMDEFYAI